MADISNLSATRNELLQRKEQINLTRAGYDLLDKKRLALLQEILRLQEEVVKLATRLEELTSDSRKSLARAEALIGESGLSSAAMGKKYDLELGWVGIFYLDHFSALEEWFPEADHQNFPIQSKHQLWVAFRFKY